MIIADDHPGLDAARMFYFWRRKLKANGVRIAPRKWNLEMLACYRRAVKDAK